MNVKPIDFRFGNNPLGPSNKAKHAVRKLVRHVGDFTPEPAALLRRYIARKEHVGEENIVFGNGSTHILDALLTLLKPGAVLIPAPVSPRHEEILKEHELALKHLRCDHDQDFFVHPDALIRGMNEADITILPNPHDMTGAIIPGEDVVRIIAEASRLDKVLILDEAYIDYSGLVSPVGAMVVSNTTVILRTFSTFHGLSGLRVGYGIGPANLMQDIGSNIKSYHMNALGPQAALASLRDKGFRQRTLLFIEGEKAYFRDKLARIDGVKCYVSPGNTVVVRINTRDEDVKKSFVSRGIVVDNFIDDRGRIYIKVPVRSRRLNALFVRVLRKVMGSVKAHGSDTEN